MSMVEELKAVLRLSEAATSGPWEACDRGSYGEENEGSVWVDETMHDIDAVSTVRPLSSQDTIRGDTTYRDAAFIAAVANLIRDHGQALVESVKDSERLDMLDENLTKFIGWRVGKAPAGNISVTSVAFLASPPVSIRQAIDLARTKASSGGGAARGWACSHCYGSGIGADGKPCPISHPVSSGGGA